ncbi:MAG: phosphatidate cytidylyltransferase [Planctomycetota bacterium]
MRTRILWGLATFFAALALFWLDLRTGGWVLPWLAILLAGAALTELYQMMRRAGLRPFSNIGVSTGVVLIPYYLWFYPAAEGSVSGEAAVALALAPLALFVFILLARAGSVRRDLGPQLRNAAVTVFGVMYVAVPLALLVRLRFFGSEGWHCVAVVVAVAKITDTGAYFCGKAFGRHRLAPRISPNKTIEGAAGGLVFGVLAWFALAHLMDIETLTRPPVGVIMLSGLAVSAAGQAGDLTESLIKRACDVKDSSDMLPVLGGVLDLIDSLLLAGPAGYVLLVVPILLLETIPA